MSSELIETCQTAVERLANLRQEREELINNINRVKTEISRTKVVSTGLSSTDKEMYAERLLCMAKAYAYLARTDIHHIPHDVANARQDYKGSLRYVRSKELDNMKPLMDVMEGALKILEHNSKHV